MRKEVRLRGGGGEGGTAARGMRGGAGRGERAAGREWLRDFPATRLAADLGNRMVANVIMLGFLSATTGVVRREALEEAIRTTVRPALLDLDLNALACGFETPPGGGRAWAPPCPSS